jgi:hypothetical protein
MLFAACHRLMAVVNAYQCNNDLHLAGNNLTKIVASFCRRLENRAGPIQRYRARVKGRAILVLKDNVERMWSITGSRTSAQGGRNAYEKI